MKIIYERLPDGSEVPVLPFAVQPKLAPDGGLVETDEGLAVSNSGIFPSLFSKDIGANQSITLTLGDGLNLLSMFGKTGEMGHNAFYEVTGKFGATTDNTTLVSVVESELYEVTKVVGGVKIVNKSTIGLTVEVSAFRPVVSFVIE